MSVNDYIKMVEEIQDTREFLLVIDRFDQFDNDIINAFSQSKVEKIFNIDSNDYKDTEIDD